MIIRCSLQALYKTLDLDRILSKSRNNLMRWVLLSPHFIDEEREAERDEATLLKSSSRQGVEQQQSPHPGIRLQSLSS